MPELVIDGQAQVFQVHASSVRGRLLYDRRTWAGGICSGLEGVRRAESGHMAIMRIRDHNKGDLALAGLTLSVAVAAMGSEVIRWVRRRPGQHRRSAHRSPRASSLRRQS